MKKLVFLCLLLTACTTVRIETQHVDGKQVSCTATFDSLFLSLESVNMSACGLKGSAAGMKGDAEFIGAVAGAAAGTAVKTVLP